MTVRPGNQEHKDRQEEKGLEEEVCLHGLEQGPFLEDIREALEDLEGLELLPLLRIRPLHAGHAPAAPV